jgi:hypothetical protein
METSSVRLGRCSLRNPSNCHSFRAVAKGSGPHAARQKRSDGICDDRVILAGEGHPLRSHAIEGSAGALIGGGLNNAISNLPPYTTPLGYRRGRRKHDFRPDSFIGSGRRGPPSRAHFEQHRELRIGREDPGRTAACREQPFKTIFTGNPCGAYDARPHPIAGARLTSSRCGCRYIVLTGAERRKRSPNQTKSRPSNAPRQPHWASILARS